jgi:hypothetical protein
MSFRLAKRGDAAAERLGWILMHFDKRDDKLDRFDGLPFRVELSDRENANRKITVKLTRHLRNDPRAQHGRTVNHEVDAVSPPQVSKASVTVIRASTGEVVTVKIAFEFARDPSADGWHVYTGKPTEWVTMNVWRVALGALVPLGGENSGGKRDVVILLSKTIEAFEASDTPAKFSASWSPPPEQQRLIDQVVSESGRVHYGTSVWFVGATGLACCPDETVFENVQAPR